MEKRRDGDISSNQLTLVPKNWHSWDFKVLDGDDQFTLIERSWSGRHGSFELDGVLHRVQRKGWWRGRFLLVSTGGPEVSATRKGFGRRFEIIVGHRKLAWKAASALSRKFELVEGDRVIGWLAPTKTVRREAVAEFPVDLARPIQIFLLYLIIEQWRQAASRTTR